MVYSILDCPEQSQTSPIRIFFNTIVLDPVINRSCPTPDAFIGSRTTLHLPLASASADLFCPENLTYAKAERIIPATRKLIAEFDVTAAQNDFGVLFRHTA